MSSISKNVTENVDVDDEYYNYSRECKAAMRIEEQHLILCIVGSFGLTGGSVVEFESNRTG